MPAITATPSQLASQQRSEDLEAAIGRDPGSFRILSGDRPTGALHLGHYFGSLHNRVRLQDAGVELLVLIADYQAITDRDRALRTCRDIVSGWWPTTSPSASTPAGRLSSRTARSAALNQLLLPFLSLVSVAEIGRNPTVKEEVAAAGSGAVTGLMFTYPVHQAADILFCHANLVPVGRTSFRTWS